MPQLSTGNTGKRDRVSVSPSVSDTSTAVTYVCYSESTLWFPQNIDVGIERAIQNASDGRFLSQAFQSIVVVT
jgi:hypothetical protein